MTQSLPAISAQGFAALGVELPALATIRVALTGGGGGKYHVPPSDLRRYSYGGCRYARPAADASTYPLFEVFGEICKKCSVTLADAPDALWRAATFTADRAVALQRARSDQAARTWLGYARYAAQQQPGDEEQFDAWLKAARTNRKLAKDARTLADARKELAAEFAEFLTGYAADCPEVDAYNGARDAVRRTAGSQERRVLDEVTAAVAGKSARRARQYEPDPEVEAWQLVCGVWLAARSRGLDAARTAALVQDAVARELAGARVVDVTRLPAPQNPGGGYDSPAAWADAELAGWWPRAVAEACARMEAEFEAESAHTAPRLLLVHDWPLTNTRDTPVAYLAACPVIGPLVPFGYRRTGYFSGAGDATGPSYSAVIAAPGHIVAKLEKEQAAVQGRHNPPRFVAAGPVTGRRRTDTAAALKLLRTAFPVLPADADSAPDTVPAVVGEQRHARAESSYRLERGNDGERASRIASSLSEGYGCWIPGGSEQTAFLKELRSWLSWQVLRLDLWCGPEGGEGVWASLYGTLDEVGDGMLALKPGGEHHPVRIPLNRVVALAGAPRWDRNHPYQEAPLWKPYEPVPARDTAAVATPQRHIRVLPGAGEEK
ncbi:hypothetical protein OG883_46205 [Streptomyces sp. NBC_01142]|uniref:hypothetical protein n=1 Tax=Streptomyces sp. NBC_01142 TaxID=2975865 RepID=UPI0022597E38|nr:hypothetical protein [Streptomyces sp. NBC_01142]MCX4827034.1 hypothetical protein [Streptomyces sp. NBC_01142]